MTYAHSLRLERASAFRSGVLIGILLVLLYYGARAVLGV